MVIDLLAAYLLSGIKGYNQVLDNPRDVSALASVVDTLLRPSHIPDPLTTIYVDLVNGDDVDGNGETGNPLQSLRRAIQFVATQNRSAKTIVLRNTPAGTAANRYTLDFSGNGLNFITVLGEAIEEEVRNVTSSSASATNGVVITVDGPTLANDEWLGRTLFVKNALSNTRNLVVRRNIGNTLYCIMTNRNFLNDAQSNPTTAADVALLKMPEVEVIGGLGLLGSIQLNFNYVRTVGSTGQLFCNSTDKVEFKYCELENHSLIAGRAGGIYILGSSVGLYGGTNGVLQARNVGDLLIGYGTVFHDKNATGTNNWINCDNYGRIIAQGTTFWRGLDANGVYLNGAGMSVIAQAGANNYWIFDNDTGTPSNAAAIKINPLASAGGIVYGTPRCVGAVNNQFYIQADLGALVTANVLSNITTTHPTYPTNTVSADGGLTASYRKNNGTKIFGGFPEFDTKNHITIANANLGKGTSAPAQIVVGNYTAWEYNIGDDSVMCIELPHDADVTQAISMHLVWGINEAYAANNGEVQWRLDWSTIPSYGSGGNFVTPTFSGNISSGDINIPATANDKYHTTNLTIAAGNFTALDLIGIKISRVALVGGSNPIADPYIVSAHLEYTSLY